jgi:hypothetical protein
LVNNNADKRVGVGWININIALIMVLDFKEINDGTAFEDLIADYFRDLHKHKEGNISKVSVKQSGVGNDGGRDILIDFDLNDEIRDFKRRWVIQCKFHNSNISPNKINFVNIPTLIHSYQANGYLLICRKNPTSGVTDLFERLNNDCKFKYHYDCWTGMQFLSKIRFRKDLLLNYFPKYNEYVNFKKG